MKLERLIKLYKLCFSKGFVKLLHDNKSNGIISIYAPVNLENVKGNLDLFTFEDDELDLYNMIKMTCYISRKRSEKVITKINEFVLKTKLKYPKDTLNYILSFKSDKVVIKCLLDKSVIKSIKIKLFTLNNNYEK